MRQKPFTTMQFNFSSAYEQAEKQYGLGSGDTFKVKDGDNYIRILSAFEPYESEYQGKRQFKFLGWILDRRDQKVKLYFMPIKVFKDIEALQNNPEYTFNEVPMPYDVNINAKNAGTIDVDYHVMGARSNVALTAEEQKDFAEKPTIGEVITKLNEKQSGKGEPVQQQTPVQEEAPLPTEAPGKPAPDFLS